MKKIDLRLGNCLSDLHTDRAGEHLVAADILMRGYDCFLAAQGMPYDMIVDVGGQLLKVQVNTTSNVRKRPQRESHIPTYLFWINRCGKGGKSTYTSTDVDLFALVALDEKIVGYLTTDDMPTTYFVRPEKLRGTYLDEKLAVRNQSVLYDISMGMSNKEASIKHSLDASYITKLTQGKGYLEGCGVYMNDLTLENALIKVSNV